MTSSQWVTANPVAAPAAGGGLNAYIARHVQNRVLPAHDRQHRPVRPGVASRDQIRRLPPPPGARRRPRAPDHARRLRLDQALSPTVSVRSVKAGGSRFLDCLPWTIIVIGAITAVCRIVAVAGIITTVIRATIVAVSAARDRATDDGTSQRARSPAKTSMSKTTAAPTAPADLNRTVRNHRFHRCHVGRQWSSIERSDVVGHHGSGECRYERQSEAMHVFLRHLCQMSRDKANNLQSGCQVPCQLRFGAIRARSAAIGPTRAAGRSSESR